jgi:predicted nucleic acid-binding protein
MTAGVDLLVSGDRDLTELEDTPVPILTPRAFLDRLNEPT